MIYQKLHIGDPPFLLHSNSSRGFPEHKHIEVELFYCTCGSFEIVIDKQKYGLTAGELAVIAPMTSHEILESNEDVTSYSIVLEFGPVMLGEYFRLIENVAFPDPIYDLKDEKYRKIYELFEDIALLHKNTTPFSSLLIKGSIYKISAYILQEFLSVNNTSNVPKRADYINAIEISLEYIYNNYNSKITVSEVADLCGYSKSNFCKIFKSITQDTFHNVLNNHRIKIACVLLANSDDPVEEIAAKVGFCDSKSFCRVFKTVKGVSPGQYRKGTDT